MTIIRQMGYAVFMTEKETLALVTFFKKALASANKDDFNFGATFVFDNPKYIGWVFACVWRDKKGKLKELKVLI